MEKERGSALILAILVLSFFMALTMNMYYMAEKKAERSGIKALGIKSLGQINLGSSLGVYEYRMSQNYEQGVTPGSIVEATALYSLATTSGLGVTTDDAIRLSNFADFFTSILSQGSPDTTTDSAVSRLYDDVNTALTHSIISNRSVGGYRPVQLVDDEVTYYKRILIEGTDSNDKHDVIQHMEYQITYKESVTTDGAGKIIDTSAQEINTEQIN
ncbi:MAG: hypothetical protein ACQERZ_08925 [Fusobacteriota bacterium]